MSTRLLESIVPAILYLAILGVGAYMVYAVIKKKPLADPNRPDNFIASLPAWPKSLHKEFLVIIGTAWSLGALLGLYGLLRYLLQ